MVTPDEHLVVGLGEALFDRFPDKVILGGAPLNLAFQAQQILSVLGGQAAVATRVGNDALGDEVVATLAKAGLNTSGVQRDTERPTGDVVIRLNDDGDASYDFTPNVAWDAMEFDAEWKRLAKSCAAVSFGTLGQRSLPSREAIHAFLNAAPQALRVCDVNLRLDFYNADILRRSLEAANVVKLNDEELVTISDALGLGAVREHAEGAKRLIDTFDLQMVALTRGPDGTLLVTADDVVDGDVPRFEMQANADTVGAGDASCAGIICGLLRGWSPKEILALSNRMGAFVASRRGATAELDDEMRDWISDLAAAK